MLEDREVMRVLNEEITEHLRAEEPEKQSEHAIIYVFLKVTRETQSS